MKNALLLCSYRGDFVVLQVAACSMLRSDTRVSSA